LEVPGSLLKSLGLSGKPWVSLEVSESLLKSLRLSGKPWVTIFLADREVSAVVNYL